jgi:UDP-glucose 4-epimerase
LLKAGTDMEKRPAYCHRRQRHGRPALVSICAGRLLRVVAPSSKELDARDQAAVQRFFADNPIDYVFHLAGHIGGIGASVTHPVEFPRRT